MNEDVIHLSGQQLAEEMDHLITEYLLLKSGTAENPDDIRAAGQRMIQVIRRLEAVQEVANDLIEETLKEAEEDD